LFLGIYLNLSIWYKLTDKTIIGAYISGIGVLITILINFYFIPKYGYWASTWATIASYFAMMVISYIWGHYKYPIPYNIYKNITVITITMLVSGMLSIFKRKHLARKCYISNFGNLLIKKGKIDSGKNS
jgi:O-antigen/teichoic acid export membrane protein